MLKSQKNEERLTQSIEDYKKGLAKERKLFEIESGLLDKITESNLQSILRAPELNN